MKKQNSVYKFHVLFILNHLTQSDARFIRMPPKTVITKIYLFVTETKLI